MSLPYSIDYIFSRTERLLRRAYSRYYRIPLANNQIWQDFDSTPITRVVAQVFDANSPY